MQKVCAKLLQADTKAALRFFRRWLKGLLNITALSVNAHLLNGLGGVASKMWIKMFDWIKPRQPEQLREK